MLMGIKIKKIEYDNIKKYLLYMVEKKKVIIYIHKIIINILKFNYKEILKKLEKEKNLFYFK